MNPDPLYVDEQDPMYQAGFIRGMHLGTAKRRHRDHLGALMLASAIGALLVVAFAVGRASAAPRSVPESSLPAAQGQTGAPHLRDGLPSAAQLEPAPAAQQRDPLSVDHEGVTRPTIGGAPSPSPDIELGTAMEGGIASFVAPSYGSLYLALPDGPGTRVRICSDGRCIERTSTDAGPDLAMQRAGRIADLSWADFAFLCRCDPYVVGLLRITIEWPRPNVTLPPTDVQP